MQHRKRYPRALVVLVASTALVACQPPAAPPAPPPPGPPPVSVAAALAQDVVDADDFPGRVEAIDTVAIRARVNGYLKIVAFKPGSEVKRGDLLFVIDPRPFQARVTEAESAVASTKVQLGLARLEQNRQERMLQSRATSQREVDAANAQVEGLEASVHALRAARDAARLNLEYTRITAPVGGRVGKDEITVGNLVQGDSPDSPVLTRLVSLDPIYVTFEADEHAYLKYIAGARDQQLLVQVGLADEQGYPHSARLEFVDNSIDSTSGTVRMRAVLDNHQRRFTPGLFARVRLQAATGARRAVLVADRAIGTDQSKRFVLVVGEGNRADYREVRLGRKVGALRVIESGLEAGEVIVVNGLQRVRPGTPIAPSTVPMPVDAKAAASGSAG